MDITDIKCEYDCPHCHTGYVMGNDGIYTDDVDDNCTTTCDACGGEFTLRCVSVDVEMETEKL